jgi:hypothetical protein
LPNIAELERDISFSVSDGTDLANCNRVLEVISTLRQASGWIGGWTGGLQRCLKQTDATVQPSWKMSRSISHV